MIFIRASLGKFKKALVLMHSEAFSPIYDIHFSIKEAALLQPVKTFKFQNILARFIFIKTINLLTISR